MKMKNKGLWKGLIVMLAAAFVMLVIPVQKVSASELIKNGTEVLDWNASYSGGMYGDDEFYKYDFTINTSGKVAFTINVEDSGCLGTGIDDVVIYDEVGTKVYSTSIRKGISTVSAELLAGKYTLSLCAGFWTGCDFSFTSAFQPSGETKTEYAMAKNNEIGMATSYKLGKTIKAQFAENDSIDIYKAKVTKNQYLNLTLYSGVQDMNIKIVDTMGDRTIEEESIKAGTHKYKYFLPKGTYYISFTSELTGNYRFKTSVSAIPTTTVTKLKGQKEPYRNNSRQITVSYKKKSSASGYQIQVARDKKFKKGKKSIKVISGKGIVTGLKKGTYYVRIRPYVTVKKATGYYSWTSKDYYSGWSKAKAVKVK